MSTSAPFKRSALGKGLESLLPARPAAPAPIAISAATEPVSTGKPLEIAVELIDRNPFQTRTNFDEAKLAELATSIAASGVVQPSSFDLARTADTPSSPASAASSPARRPAKPLFLPSSARFPTSRRWK